MAVERPWAALPLAGALPLCVALPPAIPGVGAFCGRTFPFVFVKGNNLCDGISSAVFSCYLGEEKKKKNQNGACM